MPEQKYYLCTVLTSIDGNPSYDKFVIIGHPIDYQNDHPREALINTIEISKEQFDKWNLQWKK